MAYPRTIRNYNLFVDGFGYFGRAEQVTLPQLTINETDFRGAGMDGPIGIDMGLQKMTAETSFKEWDASLVGHFGKIVRWTARAAAEGEDVEGTDAWVFEVGGRVVGLPMDALGPGAGPMLKLSWSVRYFRVEKDGENLIEVDTENAVRNVRGVDQLAGIRAAMGI